jgi:hypothetical protein
MMWSEAKNIEQSRSDELLSSCELVEGQNSMNVSSRDEGGMRKKQEQSGSRVFTTASLHTTLFRSKL